MIKGYNKTFEPHEEWDIFCEEQEKIESQMWKDIRDEEKAEQKIKDYLRKNGLLVSKQNINKVKLKMRRKIIKEAEELNDIKGW